MVAPSSEASQRRVRMIQAMAADWRGPKGRQRLLALTVSAALHAVLLMLIGLGLTQARRDFGMAEPPPILLELQPRPLLPGEVARRPARASSQMAEAATATDIPQSRPTPEDETPAPPVPRLAAPAPQGVTAPTGALAAGVAAPDPWAYRPGDRRAAMARALRLGAAGCRTLDGNLSALEQRHCDEQFNAAAAEAARRHPPGERRLNPSEARREAQFAREGAAAIARYERRRAPLAAGAGVSGASPECVGGNLRGTCPGAHLAPHFQRPEEAPFGGSARPK